MSCKRMGWLIVFCFLLGTVDVGNVMAKSTAIATLTHVKGKVEVQLSRNNKRTLGRNGLLLYPKDAIITGSSGRVTVLFRDGSEIRLFENTQFVIEDARESASQKRSFHYRFFYEAWVFLGEIQQGPSENKTSNSHSNYWC